MAYSFKHISGDPATYDADFNLYEDGVLLCKFSRKSIREDLERLGRGSKWIGSVLRLLDRSYPVITPFNFSLPDLSVEGLVRRYGSDHLLNYLRSKGFRCFKRLSVSDKEIIEFFENQGYCFEGILDGNYYRSPALIIDEMSEIIEKESEVKQ
jgi:hypothetical protein